MSKEDTRIASMDAWSNETSQASTSADSHYLRLRNAGSDLGRRSYMYFPLPDQIRRGAYVIEAKIKFTLKGTNWTTARNVTIERISEAWSEGKLSWANAPAVSVADSVSPAVAGADGTTWVQDVTEMIRSVASVGRAWGGFRLRTDYTGGDLRLYSSESPTRDVKPRLYIKWAKKPLPPIDLSPSGGRSVITSRPRFSWVFVDNFGDTEQSAFQFRVIRSSDSVVIYGPATDADEVTGKFILTEERVNSNTISGFPALTAAVPYKWQVRAWDGDGRLSEWSDLNRFQYDAVTSPTLVYPAAGSPAVVADVTPSITWTWAGATQTQARIRLLRWDPDKNDWDLIHRMKRKEYTLQSYEIPNNLIRKRNHDFKINVRLWDDKDREDTAYVEMERIFQHQPSATVNPVPSPLVVAPSTTEPSVLLDWGRSVRPDYFTLRVDGDTVDDRMNPADVETSSGSTTYRLKYWGARPDVAHTYEVAAVENVGSRFVESTANDTTPGTLVMSGIWLAVPSVPKSVLIMGTHSLTETLGETGETFEPLGRRGPVRSIDSLRGYEGTVSGRLTDEGGQTAQTWRARLESIKGYLNTLDTRLIMADYNFPVLLEEMSISPATDTPNLSYLVEFSFRQSGEFIKVRR